MVLLAVPDKLIVMTYLCQIRAFCTGQELQLVQLEGGGGAGTYRVASAQSIPPDELDASGLAQRLREHRAEASQEPQEAATRADGTAPEAASKDRGAEAVQEARSAEAPADGPGARASVPPTEGLVNGMEAPGAAGGVRLRRPSVNAEAGPVPPPRAHGSFSHVRDADLLKKRRSRLRNSSSFSGDDPDAGAAGVAAVSALQRRGGRGSRAEQGRVLRGPKGRAGAGREGVALGRSASARCGEASDLRHWCCGSPSRGRGSSANSSAGAPVPRPAARRRFFFFF